MKKWLILGGVAVLLMVAWVAVVTGDGQLQSSERRSWKQESLALIAERVADPAWPTNEVSRLRAQSVGQPSGGTDASWLSDRIILTRKGEWLAYANICSKQDRRIHDLFLARGSDERWYYSTFHFCKGMIVLRMEEQPEDLAEFTKTYFLRAFDGQSDECLQKTWPPDSR